MKIRSIELDNVRRFTDPVKVGPFGDGVTLLCQPNESGKSTLFDALYAVFFVKYTSWSTKEGIPSLQPHSGGKVGVAVEIDHDGALWKIAKQWKPGAGGDARVWRNGTLVHQGDAADDWIKALIVGDGAGPAGLLWVRQGRVSLSTDGKYGAGDKKGEEHEHRRDLLTAISGALDAVTGGQRMDMAVDVVRKALETLQNKNGKPKLHGRWAEAEQHVDDLAQQERDLQDKVSNLRDALDRQRRLKKEEAELSAPDIQKSKADDLAAAQEAYDIASRFAEKLSALEIETALAEQTYDAARAGLEQRKQVQAERVAAQQNAQELNTELQTATEALDVAALELEACAKTAKEMDDLWSDARALQRRAMQQAARAGAVERRKSLQKTLDQAQIAEAEHAEASAVAQQGPSKEEVAACEGLFQSLLTARAAQQASAPQIEVTYTKEAPALLLNGEKLAAAKTYPVPANATLDIESVAQVVFSMPDDQHGEAIAQLERRLKTALEDGDWLDIAALRVAAASQKAAEEKAGLAKMRMQALAPEGVQALRSTLASLQDENTSKDDDVPDIQTADAAVEAAEASHLSAAEAKIMAQAKRDACLTRVTKTQALVTAATERLARADIAIDALGAHDPEGGEAELKILQNAALKSAELLAVQKNQAPDLEAAKTHFERLRAVAEQTQKRRADLREELADLNARIETQAEEGVEEALSDIKARLEQAQSDRDVAFFEVEVLRRLMRALETEQSAARDRYFAPIAQELRPLLEDLWEDADIIWSDDTLLPKALVRRDTEEPIDILSGGTQEQIAFLVRLAFARLLAKSGAHAPLILDDALVYTDDDRIERLFDALHSAAPELQIIVLSCRQRAFRDLGAPQVSFQPI